MAIHLRAVEIFQPGTKRSIGTKYYKQQIVVALRLKSHLQIVCSIYSPNLEVFNLQGYKSDHAHIRKAHTSSSLARFRTLTSKIM